MRAIVTGGAGFIGSTLVDRLLQEGHEVLVVDDLSTGSVTNLANAEESPSFSRVELDVRSPLLRECFEEYAPEVVFHLAAQASVAVSLEQPLLDADVNVLGSLNVIDAAWRAGARKVVYAASGGTLYGEVPAEQLPATELGTWRPESFYGVSKMAAIAYLEAYRVVHGLDYTALALANVYGPRQNPHGEAGVIAIFADCVIRGARPRIFGDGEQTRDFVYVDDVVDAFYRAAFAGAGSVLNIGTGIETSVNEIVSALSEAVDRAIEADHLPPRAGEVRRSSLDPARASRELAWQPQVGLTEGLSRVVASRVAGAGLVP